VRIAALLFLILSSCAPRMQTIDHDGWRCIEWEVYHGALYPTVWVTCEDLSNAIPDGTRFAVRDYRG
jgi:hypothetical protein